MFIGIGMDELAIYDALQECLLTDEEFAQGIEAWQQLEDPFPEWNLTIEEALSVQSQ